MKGAYQAAAMVNAVLTGICVSKVCHGRSHVPRKNSRRARVGSCGNQLEMILVVQSAENQHRDDSMTITNLLAARE